MIEECRRGSPTAGGTPGDTGDSTFGSVVPLAGSGPREAPPVADGPGRPGGPQAPARGPRPPMRLTRAWRGGRGRRIAALAAAAIAAAAPAAGGSVPGGAI